MNSRVLMYDPVRRPIARAAAARGHVAKKLGGTGMIIANIEDYRKQREARPATVQTAVIEHRSANASCSS
jgi:hypothetical protein